MLNCVTIIIPAYNGQKYIEKTINSCLQQTHQKIEIIVIDDGSKDGTRDTLLTYKNKVKLIFNEENIGIVKNVNQAVNSINSEFFILLGHDDVLPDKHIELMISEFDNDVIGVHCNNMLINNVDENIGFSKNDTIQKLKTENCLFELSIDNFISSCGLLQRTSVFKKLKGWDETYLHYGEWLYFVKALEYGKIKYTTKTYAFYRRHDTNITNTFKDKEVIKKLNIYKGNCRKLAHKNNKNSLLETVKYIVNILKLNIKRIIL
jgi:alpha-1,3-rhamnosyltransferase